MQRLLFIILIIATVGFNIGFAKENNAPAIFTTTQLQDDFAQLYSSLKSAHINFFSNIDEAKYEQAFVIAKEKLNKPLSMLEVKIAFQKFVALGKVAHARISFPSEEYQRYRENAGKAFPIYARIQNGKWFIEEHYSNVDLRKGSEIIAINGVSVNALFKQIRQHISADTDDIAASLLEFQLPKYLWLLDIERGDEPKSSFDINVRKDDKIIAYNIDAITVDELKKRASVGEKNSAKKEKMRDFYMAENTIAYLKPGPFYNAEDPSQIWNNAAFVAFIDNAFEYFKQHKADELIIDLRENPGGDNSFSDYMLARYADKPFKFASGFNVKSSDEAQRSNAQRLEDKNADVFDVSVRLANGFANTPKGETFDFDIELISPRNSDRFTGDVYVLVNRHSYSNAVSVAAITQDYGFGKIVGESTSDFATTYGAMESFTLKHTGLSVGFPKAHIIRPSGDTVAGPVSPDIDLSNSSEESMLKELIRLING